MSNCGCPQPCPDPLDEVENIGCLQNTNSECITYNGNSNCFDIKSGQLLNEVVDKLIERLKKYVPQPCLKIKNGNLTSCSNSINECSKTLIILEKETNNIVFSGSYSSGNIFAKSLPNNIEYIAYEKLNCIGCTTGELESQDICFVNIDGIIHKSCCCREVPCNETTTTIGIKEPCSGFDYSNIIYPVDLFSPYSDLNLGEVTSYIELIDALNNDPDKPSSILYSQNQNNVLVNVYGSCNSESIYVDNSTKNSLLFLPDHHSSNDLLNAQIIVTDASNNINLGSVKWGSLPMNGETFNSNEKAGDILKVGNYIYMNLWRDIYNHNGFNVQIIRLFKIDISNPLSPFIVATLNIPIGWLSSYSEMTTDGDFIYIGGGFNGSGGSTNMVKIDLSSFTVNSIYNYTGGRVRTVTLLNNDLFFASYFGHSGLIYKVDKILFNSQTTINLPNSQVSLAVCNDGNYIYCTGIDPITFENLTVYKIDPSTFTIISSYNTGKKCLTVSGNLTFNDGKIYIPRCSSVEDSILCFNTNDLININQSILNITEIIIPSGSIPYKIIPINNCLVYITCDNEYILKLNLKTKQIIGKVCTGGDCYNAVVMQNVNMSAPTNLDPILNPIVNCTSF